MAELSPMMKQYKAIKEQHKDHILFYRLGDFYEMFFDDAVLVSKELEIALTGRDCGLPERAPMCGVPFHSCEGYIARLVKKGYKVAICEQTQNPAEAKGIVKREVIRVITPGTVIENSILDEGKNNYIATVVLNGNEAGLCFCDISTGELFATELCDKDITLKILNELGRYSPTEVLVNENCRKNKSVLDFCANKLMALVGECDVLPQQVTEGQITKHFNKSLSELDLSNKPNTTTSLGILLTYLYQTQRLGLERISLINFYNETQFMNLGLDARRNLELTETMRAKERKGSLLWVLDKTKTAMGKRLIKNYIEQPLLNPAIISKRLNAVDELLNANIMRAEIMDTLSNIYDLERLMSRIVYGSTTPHELKSLEYTAGNLPQLKKLLCDVKSNMLCEIYSGIDTLDDVKQLISSAVEDDLPTNTKDGGFIRTGFNADVDEYRLILENSKQFLKDIELAEKEKTGIKNMKIGYNRVFGYYIEVSKGNIDQVPETYIRKQTLANCERYITQDLKDLETKILTAGDKLKALELALFDDIRKKVAGELHRIQKTAQMIASLDVFCSFAQTAVQNNYTRPDITIDGEIIIKDGRHPVVEVISDMPFVANDATFDSDDNRVAIITGPNMAGKSTYMRQTALIVLMAQIGSFVPASYAKIGIVDSIFTRVGAADDLASGQSTFMVEMSEVAYILKNATK
ncbi:MAG: DNA mismatch repair protein MutS, partial [Oscillospiraceae bacterium]|nr:DNA mismatch repair protein MutS [Oscillospiraceae bacterium]